MKRKITTFLMFEGAAGEAMDIYVALFPGSAIHQVDRYGPGEQGAEGTVKRASFTLADHDLVCIDSPVKHQFTFTPSVSLFVEGATEAELAGFFARLSEGGKVLIAPMNYGFSTKFTWVNDRYGLSWQLNLA